VSTANLATEPDTAAAATDDADDADVAASTYKVCDSFNIDSLCPPAALLQPVKYPSLHIFVSYRYYQHNGSVV